MFTSKKALYFDNNFDRISPITSIDSLYFEIVKEEDNRYKVYRYSVAKHMHIACNLSSDTEYIYVMREPHKSYDLEKTNIHTYINCNIQKLDEGNPYDKVTNTHWYESSLFSILSYEYVDLSEILLHYINIAIYDDSINVIANELNDISTKINDTSNGLEDLYNLMYNSGDDTEHINDIYNWLYVIEGSNIMNIKIQNFLDTTEGSNKGKISLDIISPLNCSNNVKYWNVNFDVSSRSLTYLKDEDGNEGDYDFKRDSTNIFRTTYNQNTSCKYNTFKFVNSDSSLLIKEYSSYNKIFNSSNILINGNNNFIYNSKDTSVFGNNNNIKNCNSSLYIEGNNNIIIGCNDCSLYIIGDNNKIINLSNKNCSINVDNSLIICDNIKYENYVNPIKIKNSQLFLNGALNTIANYTPVNNITIFGGDENNGVNVFTKTYNTININNK